MTTIVNENSPKVFISYAQKDEEHKAWVRELGEYLVRNGIDVVLDQWDLKHGQDANHFMEQMVNDGSISHVLVVTEQIYQTKANDRKGGVGTESQILSPELYQNAGQERIIALVREYDAEGNPCVPTFIKSRIFIDFSQDENFNEKLDELVRALYGKPVYTKPALGKKPDFEARAADSVWGPVVVAQSGCLRTLRRDDQIKIRQLKSYLDKFSNTFASWDMRITDECDPYSEVESRIQSTLEVKNGFVEVFTELLRSETVDDQTILVLFQTFMERVYPYQHVSYPGQNYRIQNDPVRFLLLELLICLVAQSITERRFGLLARVFDATYFSEGISDTSEVAKTFRFTEIAAHSESIGAIIERATGQKRIAPAAELVLQRATNISLSKQKIIEAELVLSISASTRKLRWYPYSMPLLGWHASKLALFHRCSSASFFDETKNMFAVNDKEEFLAAANDVANLIAQNTHFLDKDTLVETLNLKNIATSK